MFRKKNEELSDGVFDVPLEPTVPPDAVQPLNSLTVPDYVDPDQLEKALTPGLMKPVYDVAVEENELKLQKRIAALEEELSGVRNEVQKLQTLTAESIGQDKDGWREVYRIHNPEMKGHGISVTTAERREGHLIERGYLMQIQDIDGREPVLRILRMEDR